MTVTSYPWRSSWRCTGPGRHRDGALIDDPKGSRFSLLRPALSLLLSDLHRPSRDWLATMNMEAHPRGLRFLLGRSFPPFFGTAKESLKFDRLTFRRCHIPLT